MTHDGGCINQTQTAVLARLYHINLSFLGINEETTESLDTTPMYKPLRELGSHSSGHSITQCIATVRLCCYKIL